MGMSMSMRRPRKGTSPRVPRLDAQGWCAKDERARKTGVPNAVSRGTKRPKAVRVISNLL